MLEPTLPIIPFSFKFERYLCTLLNGMFKEIDKSFAEALGFSLMAFNIAFSFSFKPLSTPLITPLLRHFITHLCPKYQKNPCFVSRIVNNLVPPARIELAIDPYHGSVIPLN